jgi:DNA polymerase elongation subunit (family B)
LHKYTGDNGRPKKGAPYHVRGAINYNLFLKTRGLENKFPPIQEGERIKFVALREPNPTGDRVISFIDELPTELKIEKYVDYDTQFEKSFIEPLKIILNAIGWTTERKSSLSEFLYE